LEETKNQRERVIALCETGKTGRQQALNKKIRYKILKIMFSTFCFAVLTLAASASKETFAYLTTLARSPTGGIGSAQAADILKTEGSFAAEFWPGSGGSGLKITNVSRAKVWVFFEVTGSLRYVVKPIAPAGLDPGQTYEVPLEIADVGDLGILQWRNQERTFSGEIIARVLNNYASYRLGTVEIRADKLFARLSPVEVGPGDEILSLKGIADLIRLLGEKNSLIKKLIEENKKLTEENERLQETNTILWNEISGLQRALTEANKKLSETKPTAGGGGKDSNKADGGTAPAGGAGTGAPAGSPPVNGGDTGAKAKDSAGNSGGGSSSNTAGAGDSTKGNSGENAGKNAASPAPAGSAKPAGSGNAASSASAASP
jgi:hypothetical protein